MKKVYMVLALLTVAMGHTQIRKMKVVEEVKNNRVNFYLENREWKDFDVLFEVSGTDFRQSAARPRWIRIPATSRVHLKTIILLRGKTPKYNHKLQVRDSLSQRAMKKEYTLIEVPPEKIKPKKHITIYRVPDCASCDSIVSKLEANLYLFNLVNLEENEEVKQYLKTALDTPLDSLSNPIVNLGGHLYTWITDYNTLLEELEK